MRGSSRAKADIRLAQGFLADSGLISIIDFHSRVTDSILATCFVAECFSATLGVLASVLSFLELGKARVSVFGQNERRVVGKRRHFLR